MVFTSTVSTVSTVSRVSTVSTVSTASTVSTVSTLSTVSTVIARCYLHLRWYFSRFSVVGNNVSSFHQRGQKFSHQCAVSPSLHHDKTQLRGVSCRFAFVKKETKDWRACVVQWRTLMVQKIWLASASGDRVGHSFLIVRCTPSHLIDCIGLKLRISAFYSPTFEKAVCTIFALSVGWSVSPLIFFLLFNRLE